MKQFDLWISTNRKLHYYHFSLCVEDDEIVESVMLESDSENVSLIAKLQEKIDDEPVANLQQQLFTSKSVDREPPPNS